MLRHFHIFFNLFVAAMLLAVSANNVGIMWIAVEATTIFSAFIIPIKLSKASVEASWKYILPGSVGVALAFAGTVLIYFGFATLAANGEPVLNWPVLLAIAPQLNKEAVQLAFVFLLIGYGAKAGLAPMHTWLPDAHSEAPASLSATMSGVLLAVALYAIMRWKVVVDAALGDQTTDTLLLILGLLSLTIAAFSVVVSRNYKRLLAYSSIEHIGLMAIRLALGPLGAFAALLHFVNHAVARSMLFILLGPVLHRYHSTQIKDVTGLLKTMPVTGGFFAVGMLTIMGLPPFGMFISEFTLIRAGIQTGVPWLMELVLALLAVAFVAFLKHLNGTPLRRAASRRGGRRTPRLGLGAAGLVRGRARDPGADPTKSGWPPCLQGLPASSQGHRKGLHMSNSAHLPAALLERLPISGVSDVHQRPRQ